MWAQSPSAHHTVQSTTARLVGQANTLLRASGSENTGKSAELIVRENELPRERAFLCLSSDTGPHATRPPTTRTQETTWCTPGRKSCEGEEGRAAAVQPASGREMAADGGTCHQGQSAGVALSHTTETSDSASWISQSQTEIRGLQDNNPSCIAVGDPGPEDDTSCCALSVQPWQGPGDILRREAAEALRMDTREAQAAEKGHHGRREDRGDRGKEQERQNPKNGRHNRADPLRTVLGTLPTRSEEDVTVRVNEHFDAVKRHIQGLLSAVEEFEQRSRAGIQPEEAHVGTIRPEEDSPKEGGMGATGEDEERKRRILGRGREEQGEGDDPLEQASRSGEWGHGRVIRQIEDWGQSMGRFSSARRQALSQGGDGAAHAFTSPEGPHFRVLPDPALSATAPPGISSASPSPLSSRIDSSEADLASPRSTIALISRPPSSAFLSYRQRGTPSETSAGISRHGSSAAQRSTPGRQPPPRTEHPSASSPHSPVSVRGPIVRDGGSVADAQLPHLEVFVFGRTGPLTYRMPPSVPFRKLMRYYRDQAHLRDGVVDFLWLHRNVPIRVSVLYLGMLNTSARAWTPETAWTAGPRMLMMLQMPVASMLLRQSRRRACGPRSVRACEFVALCPFLESCLLYIWGVPP